MQPLQILSIGLAIFTMLFGAGNVVFPLDLGRETGSMVWFALAGLILTGVIVPLLGLVSSALFNGDYKKFFRMTGVVPGAILALVCMLLIGPFGAIPRCMTVAYAAVHWHLQGLSLFVFSLLMAILTFAATLKRRYVVDVFGRIIGPIKITLLLTIVALGLFSSVVPHKSSITPCESFYKGFSEGYLTLDLLGTIFFSSLIVAGIRRHRKQDGSEYSSQEIARIGLKAGIIGGGLLGVVYAGFCILAAKLSGDILGLGQDQLLSGIATLVLGPRANILANITMALACITTAIALTAVVADYVTNELFSGKVKYLHALLITVSLNFAMTNLGFAGISQVILPLAIICYPALIALSLANMAHVFWGFDRVKLVTLSTLAITIVMHFFKSVM